MTTCLVLGGNGFIGSHIVDMLVENDYNVKVFDHFKSGINNLKNVLNKIQIIKGDFLDANQLKVALRDVDYVFHYIWMSIPQTSLENPVADINNVIQSVKLLEECVKANVKKIIFPSSPTVYGEPRRNPVKEDDPLNPMIPYGVTKVAVEKYLNFFYSIYGLDYTVLRYSNPYGERQNPKGKVGVITILLNLLKENKPLTIFGDGSIVRDYTYIKDTIELTLLVAEKKTKKKVFNVGTGTGTSLNELISTFWRVTEKEPKVNYIEARKGDIQKIIFDITRAREEFGWKPKISLEKGIKRTWNWVCSL